ncbi:MAG: hypothetical protein CL424_14595 [Acidimicrobiaceae bacterium]|nr:hypothetical protein [Acidimicrobiaceae bacterium]
MIGDHFGDHPETTSGTTHRDHHTDSPSTRGDHQRGPLGTTNRANRGDPPVFRPGPPQAYFGDPADVVEANDVDALRAHVRGELLRRIIGASAPWRENAACAGEPWSVFFIERGGSLDRARELCRSCPVREPCLAEAVADPELDHGYRGGASAAQRKRMRKEGAGRISATSTAAARGAPLRVSPPGEFSPKRTPEGAPRTGSPGAADFPTPLPTPSTKENQHE